MKVEEIALAVLIQFCVSSEVAGGNLRHHRRHHGARAGHRRRARLGRQQEISTTSSTTPAERYDLTSYAGDYDYQAPPLSYGAPPPDQDIDDGYVGDIPAAETVPDTAEGDDVIVGSGDDYDSNELGAASDSAANNEDVTSGGSEEVPAWCDPTHPMGAWLNYLNIQVLP